MRIFSGIQPTGDKHLGNYIGGFRQYAQTQELGEAFFCIVDLHSITVEYDPRDLHDRTLDLFAMLLATGLDPERSTVFAQSHVTAHAEASWLLSAVDELRTARPDDAVQGEGRAARVRLGGPLHLPGPDGRRHPALPHRSRADRRRPAPAPRARPRHRGFASTRASARPSSCRDGIYPEVGARIMDLQEPTRKMSTTGGTRAGHGEAARRARHDQEEVPLGGHRLGPRDPARRRQAGRLEPRRHPRRRDRADARGGRGRVRRQGLRRPEGRRRRRGRRARRARARALPRAPRRRGRASPPARRRRRARRARRRRRRSRRCTSAWASSVRGRPSSSRARSTVAAGALDEEGLRMARDDDETEIRREPEERWVTPEETTIERVEVERGTPPPVGPPPGVAGEEAIVHERQTVRQREDGAIETDTVRHEERRRSPADSIGIALLVLLLLLAAAGAALLVLQRGAPSRPSRPWKAGRSTRRSRRSRTPVSTRTSSRRRTTRPRARSSGRARPRAPRSTRARP